MTRAFLACSCVLLLVGCSQTKLVPELVKAPLPAVPAGCDRDFAPKLPPVPQIKGATSIDELNAHWARHWRQAQAPYRAVHAAHALCRKYATGVARS